MKKADKTMICPRCGRPIKYIERHRVGDRVYLYAVHGVSRKNGKTRIDRCYLGPENHYIYVTKTHSEALGMRLRNILNIEENVRQYMEDLIRYMAQTSDQAMKEKIIKILEEAIEKIRSGEKTT